MSVNYSLTVAVVDKDGKITVPLKDRLFNHWKSLSDLEKFYEGYFYPSYDIPDSVEKEVRKAISFETIDYLNSYNAADVTTVKYTEVPGHNENQKMKIVESADVLDGITPAEVKIGEDNSNLVDFYVKNKKTFKGEFFTQSEVSRNASKIYNELKRVVKRHGIIEDFIESIDFIKITDEDVRSNFSDEFSSVSEQVEDWESRYYAVNTLQGILDVLSENGYYDTYAFITSDWDVIDVED